MGLCGFRKCSSEGGRRERYVGSRTVCNESDFSESFSIGFLDIGA